MVVIGYSTTKAGQQAKQLLLFMATINFVCILENSNQMERPVHSKCVKLAVFGWFKANLARAKLQRRNLVNLKLGLWIRQLLLQLGGSIKNCLVLVVSIICRSSHQDPNFHLVYCTFSKEFFVLATKSLHTTPNK